MEPSSEQLGRTIDVVLAFGFSSVTVVGSTLRLREEENKEKMA